MIPVEFNDVVSDNDGHVKEIQSAVCTLLLNCNSGWTELKEFKVNSSMEDGTDTRRHPHIGSRTTIQSDPITWFSKSSQTCIAENRGHINRNTAQQSAITNRLLNHELNWEDVEILDEEINLNKWLKSKILYTKRQKHSLNRQADTECLHHVCSTM